MPFSCGLDLIVLQNSRTIKTAEFSFEGEPKKMEQSETELKSVLWYLWMENVDTKVKTGVLL